MFSVYSDRGQCCSKIDFFHVVIQPEGGSTPSSLYFHSLVFLLRVVFSCVLLVLISFSCFLSDGGGAGTVPQWEHTVEAEYHTTAAETKGNWSRDAQREAEGMGYNYCAGPTSWSLWGQNTAEALIWAKGTSRILCPRMRRVSGQWGQTQKTSKLATRLESWY